MLLFRVMKWVCRPVKTWLNFFFKLSSNVCKIFIRYSQRTLTLRWFSILESGVKLGTGLLLGSMQSERSKPHPNRATGEPVRDFQEYWLFLAFFASFFVVVHSSESSRANLFFWNGNLKMPSFGIQIPNTPAFSNYAIDPKRTSH